MQTNNILGLLGVVMFVVGEICGATQRTSSIWHRRFDYGVRLTVLIASLPSLLLAPYWLLFVYLPQSATHVTPNHGDAVLIGGARLTAWTTTGFALFAGSFGLIGLLAVPYLIVAIPVGYVYLVGMCFDLLLSYLWYGLEIRSYHLYWGDFKIVTHKGTPSLLLKYE